MVGVAARVNSQGTGFTAAVKPIGSSHCFKLLNRGRHGENRVISAVNDAQRSRRNQGRHVAHFGQFQDAGQ